MIAVWPNAFCLQNNALIMTKSSHSSIRNIYSLRYSIELLSLQSNICYSVRQEHTVIDCFDHHIHSTLVFSLQDSHFRFSAAMVIGSNTQTKRPWLTNNREFPPYASRLPLSKPCDTPIIPWPSIKG